MSEAAPWDADGGFREGLARGELLVPACEGCGRVLDYSQRFCDECGSGEIGWRVASGGARLRCTMEVSVSYAPELPAPYVIASVELEEGPHLLARFDGRAESENVGEDVVADFTDGGLLFRRSAD